MLYSKFLIIFFFSFVNKNYFLLLLLISVFQIYYLRKEIFNYVIIKNLVYS